jgi:hypothetical protein
VGVQAHELLNARGKTDVMNAVNYCNRLSLWVVATILHEETPRARAKMKARFVAIALVLSSPMPHTTRHDTTRHDTTRHDTTRHDTTRHDTTRHDTQS